MRERASWLLLASLSLTGACQVAASSAPAPTDNDEWRERVKLAHRHAAKKLGTRASGGRTDAVGKGQRGNERRSNHDIPVAHDVEVIEQQPPQLQVRPASPAKAAPRLVVERIDGIDDETARKRMRRNVSVVMYSTSWCGVCAHARRYMNERGIAYDERNVEARSEWRARCRELNPRGSVPTFDVDGSVMVGFGPEHLEALIDRAAERRLARGPKTLEVTSK